MSSPITKREPQALQDYQRLLNEALADASFNTDAVIALEIAGEGWLVSLKDLAETSLCPDLAVTGAMPTGVMGVGNFRGKVNTVVSMPRLLGLPDDHRGGGWATVLHTRFDVSIALWWPRMMGLFPKSDFVAASTQAPSSSVSRATWINGDARVWHELDTERLLREKLGVADALPEISDGQ